MFILQAPSLGPLSPAVFLMSLLPSPEGKMHAPAPLQHLTEAGSPIADVYQSCPRCMALLDVQKEAISQYLEVCLVFGYTAARVLSLRRVQAWRMQPPFGHKPELPLVSIPCRYRTGWVLTGNQGALLGLLCFACSGAEQHVACANSLNLRYHVCL